MKGDFSRNTFNPKKNYHAVRMQQGRVLLDADWNEMVDIVNYQHTMALHNLIGAHGGLGTGFKITFTNSATEWTGESGNDDDIAIPDLYLNAGQYYANGYSCTLADTISFENQPYFPGAADHKRSAITNKDSDGWLLYLVVWERHLTTIEDPDLVEPSLGGADTTTRSQMVWQVKMLRLENQPVNQEALAGLPEWIRLVHSQNNSLKMNQGYASENELFRIEIHSGNDDVQYDEEYDQDEINLRIKPATWKWSRDNATIAFPLQGIQRAENSEGIKDNHSLELLLTANQRLQDQFRKGNYVELDCDNWVLNGYPGWLGRITQVEAPDENNQQRLTITVSQPVTHDNDLILLRDQNEHPLIRRWDHQPASDANTDGDFHLYHVNSISQVSPSNLEILIAEEQAPLYNGDWVDLSVINGDGSWQVGQIREVAQEGELTKIRIVMTQALPDDILYEYIHQGVQIRRWNDEALPVLPNERLALEHGIRVQFPPGLYQTGDYWLIPIRSGVNTGRDFTVPPVDPARSIVPLACLSRQGAHWELTDFRRLFLDLGDVFARLESLQAELASTRAWLAALQKETDIEDEEQEEEISVLEEEVTDLQTKFEQLPILSIQQQLGKYRSSEDLQVGDVVASSITEEDYVIKASRRQAPIGVVAPPPEGFNEGEYSVVLSGPVMCRILGPVKAGDLLVAGKEPGCLEKASLWVRWFQRERIYARAIDNPTSPDDLLINVYFMPDYMRLEE